MFNSWRAKKRIQKLIKSWQEYRQVVTDALVKDQVDSGDEERFLELKASITSQLQSLTEILPPSAAVEANSHISGITGLFQKQLNLKPADGEPVWDQEQFDRIWQNHFLYLNKLKSMRLNQRQPRVDPNVPVPTGFPGTDPYRSKAMQKVPRFVSVGLILFIVIALLSWGFGVRWDGDDRLVITDQSLFGDSLSGFLGTLQNVWSNLENLFAPVVMAYGSVLSIVLVGVFLLSLGYWVFIHS